jgi:hypothetical protein
MTAIDKTISYPNIEELIVNLTDCDIIADLFSLLEISPEVSLTTFK